ncbi:hypothetical protein DFP72DRAFT_870249 [Ephemerocybe angulata]|uniref:Fe2OG dioxygenase domain-containing protein n=1 Tax=Ephemerocybe angulata TaxID=980116 RepID=A0A8H6IJS2_9AGAR|nr:hypothetical protein DFP72DRAFT_870249 [Tulosesus angulatus]
MTSTTSTAELLDPTSPAYKKARRQFYKATKNRPQNVEQDWTPFRAAEKRFKARFPPPDLSTVLDLAQLDPSRQQELDDGVWRGSTHSSTYKRLEGASKPVYVIPAVPGLVILPSYLNDEEQRELVRWSLEKQAREPNPTNLDIHYHLPDGGLWNAYIDQKSTREETILPKALDSDVVEERTTGPRQLVDNTPISVENYRSLSETPKPPPAPSATVTPSSPSSLLYKLRWANIGWYYHWGTKQYDFSHGKGEIDQRLRQICKSAVETVQWNEVYEGAEAVEWEGSDPEWKSWGETYEPDAGIVNFYQSKDTLMAHVDRSEVCKTSPLVSISLGNAAVFLIGGDTRDTQPVSILLRSGDVVIMSGACRRAYHGVPRILEGTLPGHLKAGAAGEDWAPFAEYLETTRINVNVRQVFPKGFKPPFLTS